jgi:hypothetical protein
MRSRAERRVVFTSAALLATTVALTAPTSAFAQQHGGHVHGEPEIVDQPLVQQGLRRTRVKIGGGAGMMIPQGEFGRFVRTGFAGSAHAVVGLETSNTLAIRFEGSFANYGRERFSVPTFPTTGRVWSDVSTTNNVATFGIGPQLQIASGPIQPYVNGFVGMGYFYTTSSVHGPWAWGSSLNFDDVRLGYGFGGGLGIALGPRSNVVLTMDAQYRSHDNVQYLREGGIVDDGFGGVYIDPIISNADFLTFQLGASVGL